jgi:CrcB protein
MQLPILAAVMAGGALGAGARYLVSSQVMRLLGSGFPWGTLVVNILGSAAMGLLVGLFMKFWSVGEFGRIFLTTGLLGGFTTFSAFSLEVVLLMERGQPWLAALYVLVSVVACVGGLQLALWLMRGAA